MAMTELSFPGGGKLLVASHAVTAVHAAPASNYQDPPCCAVYVGQQSFKVSGTYTDVTAKLYPVPVEAKDETIDEFIAAIVVKNPDHTTTVGDCYLAYARYCDENALDGCYRSRFAVEMRKRGFATTRGTTHHFKGIILRDQPRKRDGR